MIGKEVKSVPNVSGRTFDDVMSSYGMSRAFTATSSCPLEGRTLYIPLASSTGDSG